MTRLWQGALFLLFAGLAVQGETVLLTDNFGDASIDSSKWTLITATGSASFDEATAGNQVTETGGYMFIQHSTPDGGGAYKSKLLPVNDLGQITIARRIYVGYSGAQVSMPEEIMSEAGTVLLRWGYYYQYDDGVSVRNGFGGIDDTLTAGLWTSWRDEVITYDPVTGQGTYSLEGGTPVAITGTPLPAGTTNLYLRGGAYGSGTGHYKAFEDFTVTQPDLSLLTVSSDYGSPVPDLGTNVYDTGSTVTCSVANVTVDGIEYECTGWSGSGAVPASGTTNEVVLTLSDDASITWLWSAVLLDDDFEDGVLDSAKWTAISAMLSTFEDTPAGDTLSESNGVMKIDNNDASAGGAYRSALLPVNESGQIVVTRRTQVEYMSWDARLPDVLMAESGEKLLEWNYTHYYDNTFSKYIDGFGQHYFYNYVDIPLATSVWGEWFDEVICYDPSTGLGTYSINGGDPVFIMDGAAMPAGTTNVYLQGSAFDLTTGSTKQIDTYTVSQEPPVSLFSVESELGSPFPEVGDAFFESGSVITCSVEDVVADGVWYQCVGWTGTGSVPASGTTNEVVVQLNEGSSITWAWQTNYWVEVDVVGSGSTGHSSGFYAKDSVLELSATPDSGWDFLGWSGDGSGFMDVSLTVDEPKSLRATFLDSALNTILLQDDFDDESLNTSVWTGISATAAAGFDEAVAGNSLKETNGVLHITMGSSNNGGAYKTSDLLVNDQGEIVITRRTKVYGGGFGMPYDYIYMTENLMGAGGTTLLAWGYYDLLYSLKGFGGYSNQLASAVWNEWFDETITYDPVSGAGTYSINGSTPLLITGTALPGGVSNVYLRGGAYCSDSNGPYKLFDTFSVVQGEASDYSLLTVNSALGAPVPAKGDSIYESGTIVTCSVPEIVGVGGFGTPYIRYQCTGWTGSGAVPASGTTNEVVVTMDEHSSITWNWEAIDVVLSVSSSAGNATPSVGNSTYEIGSVVTCSVPSLVTVNGVRFESLGWTGAGSVPASGTTNQVVVTIGETSSITWNWNALDGRLVVTSAYGDPVPSVGEHVYLRGTEVTCSVEDVIGSDTRHLCTGWARYYDSPDSGTTRETTFTLDDYAQLFWGWQTDHRLQINIEGPGSVNATNGFYAEGTALTLVPTPAEGAVFDGWAGDASGTGNASITMSSPRQVTAMFSAPASIENLSVAQVEGERVVEVSYDVAGTRPILVDLDIFQNGSNLNAYTTGDLGMVAAGSNRMIRWPAYGTWNYNVDELTFSLIAEDGLPFYLPYTGGTVSVPQTGQTTSYSSYTVEDGDILPGMEWPEPRFTDNGDNTVTDNLTGLMWAKAQAGASWYAALNGCENSTLAGHDDWRLPNVRELRSLLGSYGRYSPTVTPGTFSMGSVNFWTGTTWEYNAGYKYFVSSATGSSDLLSAGSSAYYLSVRLTSDGPAAVVKTGQTNSWTATYGVEDGDLQLGTAPPDPRFTDNGDGTVTDNLTGLTWLQTWQRTRSWAAALSYAQTLTAAGKSDWRLPSINELETLIDYGQKYPTALLPAGHPFANVQNTDTYANWCWSATTYQASSGYAFTVNFYDGSIVGLSKGTGATMLCCRGGVEIAESIPEASGEYPLPQSGQTNSVASGDDGDVQAGIASPDPRFTRTGTYTVLDNLTGLLWYISMDNQSYYEYWHSAVSDADANTTSVDWRLPNIREMLSLIDLGEDGPALPAGHPFQNVQTNANYWTSTTLYTNGTSYAWQVNLGDGRSSIANRFELNGQFYAMVYGPTAQPQVYVHKTGQTNSVYTDDDGANQRGYEQSGDRFTDNGNYTVSDNRTGLMWLQAVDACDEMTWAEAVAYCEALNFGGYTDWRLPNARELESLVDYSRGGTASVLPEGHPFTDFDLRFGSTYWTSTTLHSDTNIAVAISLYTGNLSGWTKDNELKVWPVRGGN